LNRPMHEMLFCIR